MSNLNSINQDLKFALNIGSIIQTYEEIAVIRMQQIRQKIIDSRKYIDGLGQVYQEVRISNEREIAKLEKKLKKVMVEKGECMVVLTPNTGLYGTLVNQIMDEFIKNKLYLKYQVVVIGKLGAEIWKAKLPKVPATFFPAPEVRETNFDWSPLIEHLSNYGTINVYHGQYVTLLNQQIMKTNITGNEELLDQAVNTNKKADKDWALFEPSIKDIMTFFSAQVTSILLRQTVSESQLSLLGSRIQAMEKSLDNAHTKLKLLTTMQKKEKHQVDNRKQLQQYSGMALW